MEMNANTLWEDLKKVRSKAPLVHNITNYVVMNNTANALLALGASPVMAHAKEEVADMVNISRALVINIGTLSKEWVESMKIAAQQAKERKKPIIFDPVGVGATNYRTQVAKEILAVANPAVIRGNASEIMALTDDTLHNTKGVDSTETSVHALAAAGALSKKYHCTVVVSGETDLIIDGNYLVKIKNGHPLMAKVTGMGCTASALIGAFCGVNAQYFAAAAHAMGLMGIAGELAELYAKGPGSLQLNFLDTLFQITEKQIHEHLRLEIGKTERTLFGD